MPIAPMNKNMPCHGAVSRMTCPTPGARIGTIMNTDQIIDMISAIARPL